MIKVIAKIIYPLVREIIALYEKDKIIKCADRYNMDSV